MRQPTNGQRDPNDVLRGLLDKPAAPPKPSAPARPVAAHIPWYVKVVMSLTPLAFGLPLWFASARFSRDGWISALNMFLRWLDVPHTIATPPWQSAIALIVAIGLVYSVMERSWRVGVMLAEARRYGLAMFFWLALILIGATDVGSTIMGVSTPAPDAWSITRWIAETRTVAIVWASFLTIVPDLMILNAITLWARKGA